MVNKKYPCLVVVEWHDAWVKEEPVLLEDAKSSHAPTKVTTIGWVLYEDESGVSLANEHYDASWRGRTFIPRAMIITVTSCKLTIQKPKSPKSVPESASTPEAK